MSTSQHLYMTKMSMMTFTIPISSTKHCFSKLHSHTRDEITKSASRFATAGKPTCKPILCKHHNQYLFLSGPKFSLGLSEVKAKILQMAHTWASLQLILNVCSTSTTQNGLTANQFETLIGKNCQSSCSYYLNPWNTVNN